MLTATNPETGTVTNTYESLTGLLLHKIDAKNNKVAYTYDSYKRVTEIKRYVWENGAHVEKVEQGTKFYYDSNPFLGGWATNLNGRLAAVETYSKRGGAAWNAPGGGNAWTTMTFREMYSYSTGGLMLKKRLALSGQYSTGQPVASDFLESSYTFDSEGRMTGQVYPAAHDLAGGVEVAGASYTYGFDDMGRPKTMAQSGASTLVSDVTYNAASQPLTITAGVGWVNSEARVYNALGQLTSLTNGTRRFEYDFSPTANDGRITTQRSYAGALQETITYSYDALNRLSSAGQSGVWSAAYSYDGFGNLTNVTPTGTGPSAMNVAIDAATNRVTGGGWVYDANGNATSMPGGFTGSYDVENRLLEANKNFAMLYGYGADNRRIYEVKRAAVSAGGDTTEEYVTYWSGQRIGKYKVRWDSTSVFVLARAEAENVYFGSKPLRLGAETNVVTDRLGSVRRDVRDYFPYGQERSATAGDQEKYGTYKHDAATDLSYADQRYYATGAGRFMTADPYKASAGAAEPESWNRYAYVGGDPVNFGDPSGQARCSIVSVETVGASSKATLDCISIGGIKTERFETAFPYNPRDLTEHDRFAREFSNSSEAQDLDQRAEAESLQSAGMLAVTVLRRPTCRGLFKGGVDPADALLRGLRGQAGPISSISFANLGAAGNEAATKIADPILFGTEWQFLTASIRINREGPWMTLQYDRGRYGNYSDMEFKAETLIHELVHVWNGISVLGGSTLAEHGDDSLEFDREIFTQCFGAR